jgi:predicted PurR-regulated permease PerM
MREFNQHLRQLLLLGIILSLIAVLFISLNPFIPGILGTITLYILSREKYFHLVYQRKWRKGWTAGLFLFFYLVILGVPFYIIILLLSPRVNEYLSHPDKFIDPAKNLLTIIQERWGLDLLSPTALNTFFGKLSATIPGLINSSTNLLFNLVLMLFLLYYMLINGKTIEYYFYHITPLKAKNIHTLVTETKKNIKANALGIPLISIIQGIIATFGYYIFHLPDFLIWGLLTGLFAFFPIVGTMIIWVPIVIYLYAIGQHWQATAIMLYSLIITGNIDSVARMTLLKTIGNVHPVVTIIGVISGLSLFGFIGIIFGPLLVSYIGVLFTIYRNEFTQPEDISNK